MLQYIHEKIVHSQEEKRRKKERKKSTNHHTHSTDQSAVTSLSLSLPPSVPDSVQQQWPGTDLNQPVAIFISCLCEASRWSLTTRIRLTSPLLPTSIALATPQSKPSATFGNHPKVPITSLSTRIVSVSPL